MATDQVTSLIPFKYFFFHLMNFYRRINAKISAIGNKKCAKQDLRLHHHTKDVMINSHDRHKMVCLYSKSVVLYVCICQHHYGASFATSQAKEICIVTIFVKNLLSELKYCMISLKSNFQNKIRIILEIAIIYSVIYKLLTPICSLQIQDLSYV